MKKLGRLYWITALLALLLPGMAAAQDSVDAPSTYENIDKNGVDRVSGNFNTSATDVSIGPYGPHGLAYTRYWSGKSYYSGGGWRELVGGGLSGTFENPIVTLGNFSISFTETSGSSNIYTDDKASGASLVTPDGGITFTFTARDGTVAYFVRSANFYYGPVSNLGAIDHIVYPDGNVINFTYRTNDNCNGSYVYACFTFARLQSIINSFGYMLKFGYQTNTTGDQNLFEAWATRVSVTAINTAVDACDAYADSCTFTRSWPTVTYDNAFFPTTITDAIGRVSRYSYDGNGRLTGLRRPGVSTDDVTIGYDSRFRVQSISKTGATWTYAYTLNGDSTQQTTAVTDPAGGQRTTVSSVSTGLATSSSDETNAASNFTYDGNGRLTLATKPDGNSVAYSYDGRGNVTQTTLTPKPNQNVGATISTSAYYDPNCANARICNQPIWTRDANGNQTDYSYDAGIGRMTSVTAPAGANGVRPQIRYYYANVNGAGLWLLGATSVCRTTASCAGGGDETRADTTFGTASQNYLPLSVTTHAGDNSVSSTSSQTYDLVGNVAAVTDPLGSVTTLTYDADRELVETIGADPDGGGPMKPRAVRVSYNVDGTVAQKEVGTDTGSNFQSLQQAIYGYDGYGRTVSVAATAGGTTYSYVQRAYDNMSRLHCQAVRMNPAAFGAQPDACALGAQGNDGPDRITVTGYDATSRVNATIAGYGTSVQATAASATYTVNGKVASATDANGNTTTYTYDGFDRLVTTTYPGSSYEQLTLDAKGEITSHRLRDGQSIGYGYDALGHLTGKVRPDHYVFWETDLTYAWDNLGELVQASDGNGRALGYAYDALGRVTSQSDAWYATGNASFQYDAAGRRTRMTWWDGQYVQYSYDALGEMTEIAENGGPVPVAFGYDDLGRRTALYRANGASAVYNYDPASRLSSLTHYGNTNITWSYGYNAAGQITSRTQSNDAYAWGGAVTVDRGYGVNGLNQYTSSGGTALGYDGRGNLTSSGSSSYGYTSENQLASSPNTQLGYDALGRLFNITSDQGRNTTITSEDDRLLAEIDQSTGAVLRRYVYGPGTDEPLLWYEGGDLSNRRYLHPDERGSIVAITDNAGGVIGINSYDEFGIPGANNIGRFQYTGQKWLPALGMYDYKARTYSPTLGRFLQTDPIGYGDGMNWHNYAHADPVNSTDPSGTDACEDDDCDGQGGDGGGDGGPGNDGVGPAHGGPLDGKSVIPSDHGPLYTPDGHGGYNYVPLSNANISSGGDGTAGQAGSEQPQSDIIVTGKGIVQAVQNHPYIATGVALGVGVVLCPECDVAEILVTARRASWFSRLFQRIFRQACFAAGTLVQTDHGLRPIETIKPGDMVLSRDGKTGRTAYKRVTAVKTPTRDDLYTVELDVPAEKAAEHHAEFQATATHPWRTMDGHWVKTADLRNGMQVVRADGAPAKVEWVSDTHRLAPTYNLTVEGYHTYFVGKDRVWVHNSCEPTVQDAQQALRSDRDFRTYFHRWKQSSGLAGDGAGVRNSDLSGDDILEAYQDWISDGKPRR